MHLPRPRGPLSSAVLESLSTGVATDHGLLDEIGRLAGRVDVLGDDDLHLSLWVLYELHYRGFDGVTDREWDPDLLRVRREMERPFEAALRDRSTPVVEAAKGAATEVPEQIEHLIAHVGGPGMAQHVQRNASLEQFLEFMRTRSIYTLKESDPSSFLLPRIDGAAKAALAELQYDEYGAGRADRLHATLFARALEACGLDATYGAYVDETPGHTLAENNAMSLFALHRRLRGAGLGHLTAFEATSSLPCRRITTGVQRLGLPDAAWEYFDEHVEADAVHEQVALRGICATAVADEPDIHDDVLLGAAVCLQLAASSASATLNSWGVAA